MDSVRQSKISRLIQRELSDIFQKGTMSLFNGVLVSATNVRISSDLSYAKIYVSIFPNDKEEATIAILSEKNKTIRYELGKRVGKQMRIIPELRFFVDDSLEYIERIDNLLK